MAKSEEFMKQRGRKSAEAHLATVETIPRQPPPQDLSAFEAQLWMAVTSTKPADWFQADTLPLLRSYVRHCAHAAKIDQEMDELLDKRFTEQVGEAPAGAKFESLAKMRERETKQITALARSMRLTQQAQIHPEKAGTSARKGKASRPWEG